MEQIMARMPGGCVFANMIAQRHGRTASRRAAQQGRQQQPAEARAQLGLRRCHSGQRQRDDRGPEQEVDELRAGEIGRVVDLRRRAGRPPARSPTTAPGWPRARDPGAYAACASRYTTSVAVRPKSGVADR